MNSNSVTISGARRSSDAYGAGYLSEFGHILQRVKPVTRSWLEWGMGHTTLAVLDTRSDLPVDDFYSIDDNQDYFDQMVAQLPTWAGFHPICLDLMGPKRSDRDPELNYSSWPLSLGRKFDFIFIDGRRRMECAFVASLLCHAETIVVLHDYRRVRYQHVTALFEVIDDGPQFRVMRLR